MSSQPAPEAKPRAHFLHVGKCGGTAINTALQDRLDAGRYEIVLDGHDVDLRQIPAGEKFFFVVRDPLERYVSSFNDRQRRSRPRYDVGWTLEEERAYARFHTPDELGRALSSPDDELRAAAHEAITTIYHVRHSYWHWFVDPELFAQRLDDLLFVMWLPALQSSFRRLCELLELPGLQLPSDDVAAHRQATSASTDLSRVAKRNLKAWYRRDYQFLAICSRLEQATPELRAHAAIIRRMSERVRAQELGRRVRAAASALRSGSVQPARTRPGPEGHPSPPPDRVQAAIDRDGTDFQSMRRLLAFTLTPDSCCIDVGAHRGSVLAEMLRVAPQGRHLAFEPIPQLAALLRQRIPGVEVHEAALSDHTGEAKFAHVLGAAEGWSGLRFRPLPTGEEAKVEDIKVRLAVLDEMLDPVFRPTVIKIDVEGAEESVLRGALQTLRRHHPVIIFEHGSGSAEEYGTTPAGIYALLREGAGYRIFDLDGNGPYEREEFERTFYAGERVNFVAHP